MPTHSLSLIMSLLFTAVLLCVAKIGAAENGAAENDVTVPSASPTEKRTATMEVKQEEEGQRDLPIDYVERTITSYCKCAEPSLQVYREIAEAMSRGDVKTLQSIQPRMPALATKLHRCDEYLRDEVKRRQSIKDFHNNVQEGIQKRCPRQ